jgi:hypothetical protein
MDWTTVVQFSARPWIYFLFAAVPSPALRPTQPPIKSVPAALYAGVKRPGREANHSSLSSAEFNNFTFTFTLSLRFKLKCVNASSRNCIELTGAGFDGLGSVYYTCNWSSVTCFDSFTLKLPQWRKERLEWNYIPRHRMNEYVSVAFSFHLILANKRDIVTDVAVS